MSKKSIMIPITLLAAVLLVGGPTWWWSQFRVARDRVREGLEGELSDQQVERLARAKLEDLDGQIRQYRVAVGKLARKCAAEEVKLGDLHKQLDAEKKVLARSRQMLARDDDRFLVGTRDYSRAEMEADARVRLTRCRQLEVRADSQAKLVEQLRQALSDGEKNLVEAHQLRQELTAELEATKARLINARARQELADMTAQLRATPYSADSDLGKWITRYRERAEEADLLADTSASLPAAGVVDWEGRPQPEDLGKALDDYLGQATPQK